MKNTEQTNEKLVQFLQACHGNWRNSLYIDCGPCPRICSINCHDMLCAIDTSGTPVIISSNEAANLWHDTVSKDECIGSLSVHVFEELYKNWIYCHIHDPFLCHMTDIHDCPQGLLF